MVNDVLCMRKVSKARFPNLLKGPDRGIRFDCTLFHYIRKLYAGNTIEANENNMMHNIDLRVQDSLFNMY